MYCTMVSSCKYVRGGLYRRRSGWSRHQTVSQCRAVVSQFCTVSQLDILTTSASLRLRPGSGVSLSLSFSLSLCLSRLFFNWPFYHASSLLLLCKFAHTDKWLNSATSGFQALKKTPRTGLYVWTFSNVVCQQVLLDYLAFSCKCFFAFFRQLFDLYYCNTSVIVGRGCRIGPLCFLSGWHIRRLIQAFSSVLV